MLTIKKILASDTNEEMLNKLNSNFQQFIIAGGGPQGKYGQQGFPGLPGKDGEKGLKGDDGIDGEKFIVFNTLDMSSGVYPPILTVENALLAGYKDGDIWFNSDTRTYYILDEENLIYKIRNIVLDSSELVFKKDNPSGNDPEINQAILNNLYLTDVTPTDDQLADISVCISSIFAGDLNTVYSNQNFSSTINSTWRRKRFKFSIDQIYTSNGAQSFTTKTGLYAGSPTVDEFTPVIYIGEKRSDTLSYNNFGILIHNNESISDTRQTFSIQGALENEYYFQGSKIWTDGDYLTSYYGTGVGDKNFGYVFKTNLLTSSQSLWLGMLTLGDDDTYSTNIEKSTGIKINKVNRTIGLDFYTTSDYVSSDSNIRSNHIAKFTHKGIWFGCDNSYIGHYRFEISTNNWIGGSGRNLMKINLTNAEFKVKMNDLSWLSSQVIHKSLETSGNYYLSYNHFNPNDESAYTLQTRFLSGLNYLNTSLHSVSGLFIKHRKYAAEETYNSSTYDGIYISSGSDANPNPNNNINISLHKGTLRIVGNPSAAWDSSIITTGQTDIGLVNIWDGNLMLHDANGDNSNGHIILREGWIGSGRDKLVPRLPIDFFTTNEGSNILFNQNNESDFRLRRIINGSDNFHSIHLRALLTSGSHILRYSHKNANNYDRLALKTYLDGLNVLKNEYISGGINHFISQDISANEAAFSFTTSSDSTFDPFMTLYKDSLRIGTAGSSNFESIQYEDSTEWDALTVYGQNILIAGTVDEGIETKNHLKIRNGGLSMGYAYSGNNDVPYVNWGADYFYGLKTNQRVHYLKDSVLVLNGSATAPSNDLGDKRANIYLNGGIYIGDNVPSDTSLSGVRNDIGFDTGAPIPYSLYVEDGPVYLNNSKFERNGDISLANDALTIDFSTGDVEIYNSTFKDNGDVSLRGILNVETNNVEIDISSAAANKILVSDDNSGTTRWASHNEASVPYYTPFLYPVMSESAMQEHLGDNVFICNGSYLYLEFSSTETYNWCRICITDLSSDVPSGGLFMYVVKFNPKYKPSKSWSEYHTGAEPTSTSRGTQPSSLIYPVEHIIWDDWWVTPG